MLITLNGKACLDPMPCLKNMGSLLPRWRDRYDRIALAQLTNRFTDVAGHRPSYGYFLVTRKLALELAELDRFTLHWEMFDASNREKHSLDYQGLIMVKSTSLRPTKPSKMTGSIQSSVSLAEGNDYDPFVVEVADRRYLGVHPTIRLDSDLPNMFNIQVGGWCPGILLRTTCKESFSDGNPRSTPWSWQEVFDQIWPTWLSDTDAPTLPYIPDKEPMDLDLRQWPDYERVCIFLDRLSCYLAPNRDGTYRVLRRGDDDANNTANQRTFIVATNAGRVDEEMEWIEPVKTFAPKGVRVHFQRRTRRPGSEQVLEAGSTAWYGDMSHTEDKDAEASDVDSTSALLDGVYHRMWDDMPAITDSFDISSMDNASDMVTRAGERKTEYYKMLSLAENRHQESWSGLLNVSLSGLLNSISWWQDHSCLGAIFTDTYYHPWTQLSQDGGMLVPEGLFKPAYPWQWKALPVYPPRTIVGRLFPETSGSASGSTSGCEYRDGEMVRAANDCDFQSDVNVKILVPQDGEQIMQLVSCDPATGQPVYFAPDSGTTGDEDSSGSGSGSTSDPCPGGTTGEVVCEDGVVKQVCIKDGRATILGSTP